MDRGHRHGGLLARANRSGHAVASDTEAWFLRPLIFPSAATKDQSGPDTGPVLLAKTGQQEAKWGSNQSGSRFFPDLPVDLSLE